MIAEQDGETNDGSSDGAPADPRKRDLAVEDGQQHPAQRLVLALGMAYGWRLGGATLLLYLAEGAMGLPVFAGTPEKGIGVAYMLSGTGGYLIGFVLAAALCGWLAERGWDRRFMTTALALLIGNIAIYVPGLLWLGSLFGWDKPILEWGLTPFLLGDLTKLLLAAVALPIVWRALKRR
jgi:biotin transport system substrate-specific component